MIYLNSVMKQTRTMTFNFEFYVMVVCAVTCVNAEFVETPRDTVVYHRYTAYLNCSIRGMPQDIRWNHYAVGARLDQNKLVYTNTHLQPPYDVRLRVEKSSITSANLIFPSANFDDAGRYDCIEDSSRRRNSAQLIVLESLPVCETNFGGVIVQSKCGAEPDIIVISCRVSYRGNISPSLQWTKRGSNEFLNKDCTEKANTTTCSLTLLADQVTDGVSFVCRTSNSGKADYSCSTDKFKVIYSVDNDSIVKRSLYEEVRCLETSSPLCSYRWKYFDGESFTIVPHNLTLTLTRPGRYKCEADCRRNGNVCTVVQIVVEAEEISTPTIDSIDSTKTMFFFILLALAVCAVVAAFTGYCFHCKSTRGNRPQGRKRVKSSSEANEVEEELDEANQVEVNFYEVDEFYDGIPDDTVTSFVDLKTDKASCYSYITKESQLEGMIYTNSYE